MGRLLFFAGRKIGCEGDWDRVQHKAVLRRIRGWYVQACIIRWPDSPHAAKRLFSSPEKARCP